LYKFWSQNGEQNLFTKPLPPLFDRKEGVNSLSFARSREKEGVHENLFSLCSKIFGKIFNNFGMKNNSQKFYPSGRPNVLVTGGAGFLGSHLCEILVRDNNVICVDNLLNPFNYHHIESLLRSPNFYFIKKDVNEPLDLLSMSELKSLKIKFQGIQEIYHLACPTSAKSFEKLKIETLKANSVGMLNILELARSYKAKMLFTSSSVVYGPRSAKPRSAPTQVGATTGDDSLYFKETDLGKVNFIGGRACYDEGKRFAETMMFTYQQMYDLDIKVARIFRTYGPRLALFEGEMISDFALQAINNEPLVIYGNENFDTSLCYVSDTVEGMMALMKSSESGPFNLGASEAYRLVDIAKKIIEMTGSSSLIKFLPPLLFMTPLGLPDISLAKEKLGWFPVIRPKVGLLKTIEYVKTHKTLLSPMMKQEA